MPKLCDEGGTDFSNKLDIMNSVRGLVALFSVGYAKLGRRTGSVALELGRTCRAL